jgi:hypothetical protein
MNEQQFFEKSVKNKQFPGNDALKQIILKRIMRDFELGKVYAETEVNEIIKKYFDDFTLIRRELVNFGYMSRDPYKGEYKVVKKELTKEDYEKITTLKRHAEDLER